MHVEAHCGAESDVNGSITDETAELEDPWAAAAAALHAGASVQSMITSTFRGIYGEDVAAAQVVRATKRLDAAMGAYEKAAAAAEAAVATAVARRAAGRPPFPAKPSASSLKTHALAAAA